MLLRLWLISTKKYHHNRMSGRGHLPSCSERHGAESIPHGWLTPPGSYLRAFRAAGACLLKSPPRSAPCRYCSRRLLSIYKHAQHSLLSPLQLSKGWQDVVKVSFGRRSPRLFRVSTPVTELVPSAYLQSACNTHPSCSGPWCHCPDKSICR